MTFKREEFQVDFALNKKEKALLIGIVTLNQSEKQMKEYLDELSFLTTTAGAEPISIVYQKLDHPDTRTYIGSGKLQEVKKIIEAKDIDVVLFDAEITLTQPH